MAKNDQSKKESQNRNAAFFRGVAKYLIIRAQNQNITQDFLAERAEVSQGTISKWLNNEGSPPNIIKVLKMCMAVDISFDALLYEMGLASSEDDLSNNTGDGDVEQHVVFDSIIREYSKEFKHPYDVARNKWDVCYDNSSQHLQRLHMFEKKEYIGFYLHLSRKKNLVLNALLINTGEVDERGFCPFTMNNSGSVATNKLTAMNNSSANYAGKIVSHHGTFYCNFFLTGGDPTDRGMWTLYYPPNITGGYKCGVGVLLSVDRSNHSPSFQRIVMVDKAYYKKEYKDCIIDMLKKPFLSDKSPIINFPMHDLQLEHEVLYTLIRRDEE